MNSIEERLRALEVTAGHMAEDLAEIKDILVTRVEFTPVQRVVYGLVGIILAAVMGAFVALVLK